MNREGLDWSVVRNCFPTEKVTSEEIELAMRKIEESIEEKFKEYDKASIRSWAKARYTILD